MSRELFVFIEIKGQKVLAGKLTGSDYTDTCFLYDSEYMSQRHAMPISVSLPLQTEAFTPEQTRIFFNGLLPEGYTRRCVAAEINAGDDDYISILENLGRECLGAIQILPSVDVSDDIGYETMSEEQLHAFAKEGASTSAVLVTKSHLSLTGASGKAGLYRDEKDGKWYLPIGSAPSTHIVKQSHVRLSKIVANEQLCMITASKLGIRIPYSEILKFENNDDDNVLFATRRYDRVMGETNKDIDGHAIPLRLHQEDFAQALGIPSERKYEKSQEHYLKRMFHLVGTKTANPIQSQMELWRIVVFNYLVGNTDNHIKNTALLYNETLESLELAPAYDMVSTLVYDNSTENMAMSINEKYDIYEIAREDFEEEARSNGLNAKIYMKEFDRMRDAFVEKLLEAEREVELQGFLESHTICEKILEQWKQRFPE